MRKIFVTILLIAGIAFTSNAQTKNMAVGADLVLSLPIGTFGDAANVGFGGLGSFEYAFMPQLVGTGQIGYIAWGTDIPNASFHAIPILVGVKYFFVPNIGFYGTSQLGFAVLTTGYETPTFDIFGTTYGGSVSNSTTEFSFSIGAGYELPVSPNVNLDFSALFNIISDANNIQIRAGAKYAL